MEHQHPCLPQLQPALPRLPPLRCPGLGCMATRLLLLCSRSGLALDPVKAAVTWTRTCWCKNWRRMAWQRYVQRSDLCCA